jgi:hypothetical protein
METQITELRKRKQKARIETQLAEAKALEQESLIRGTQVIQLRKQRARLVTDLDEAKADNDILETDNKRL